MSRSEDDGDVALWVQMFIQQQQSSVVWMRHSVFAPSAPAGSWIKSWFSLLSTLLRKHLRQAYVNQRQKKKKWDQLIKATGDKCQVREQRGCQVGGGHWRGAVKGIPGILMSNGIQAHLIPASPNHWTIPERWPPPSSTRSSVSVSLCRREEEVYAQRTRYKYKLCVFIYFVCYGAADVTHVIFGWREIVSSPEVASAGWAPEWPTWRSSPWSHQPCRLCSWLGRQWQSTMGQHALHNKSTVTWQY